MGWMPISTAPDYGVRFLAAYRTEGGAWAAEVVALERGLVTSAGAPFPATHWAPLPAPPDEDRPAWPI